MRPDREALDGPHLIGTVQLTGGPKARNCGWAQVRKGSTSKGEFT